MGSKRNNQGNTRFRRVIIAVARFLGFRVGPRTGGKLVASKRTCKNGGDDKRIVIRNIRIIQKAANEKARSGRKKCSKSENVVDSNSKSFIDEEVCYFDHLPPEVMQAIFSYLLRFKVGPGKLRLVCKSWNDILCREEKFLKFHKSSNLVGAADYFKNCGYKKLHLKFYDTFPDEISNLPASVWEKFGPKIQSLDFNGCPLEDCLLRRVILYCDNLKHLNVELDRAGSLNEQLFRSQTLEVVNVVRPKLESLKIRTRPNYPWKNGHKFYSREWSLIFINLIQIFPNIIHFTLDHSQMDDDTMHNSTKFSRQLDGGIDKSSLSWCLAYLMSDDEKEWKKGIYEMTKLSLTAVSLEFESLNRFEENGDAILDLFTNQKTLKYVSISTGPSKSRFCEDNILTTIFLAIIYNNPDLLQLSFNPPQVKYSEWMNNLIDLLPIDQLQLDDFQSGPFKLHSRSLSYLPCYTEEINPIFWFQHFSYIQYLTVDDLSNELLQLIIIYMPCLKGLRASVYDEELSIYALPGRSKETQTSSIPDYPINQLQNLEKLDIKLESNNGQEDFRDALLRQFAFPKLRRLHCFIPKESSTYIDMALKMPLLTELKFYGSLNISLTLRPAIMELAQRTKNLHTLNLSYWTFFTESDVKVIFNVCPSLRYFYSETYVDYYDPLTKEVRRKRKPLNFSSAAR